MHLYLDNVCPSVSLARSLSLCYSAARGQMHEDTNNINLHYSSTEYNTLHYIHVKIDND